MRNNRLLITYDVNFNQFMLTPRGYKESLRTKSLDRAKEIIEGKNSYYISNAVFKDGNGVEATLINKKIVRDAPAEEGGFKDVTKDKN